MVHTVCVHDHLKIATSKMKILTNTVLKQLGNMVIKMPAFEMLTLNLLAPTTLGARINPQTTNVIYVCVCVCVYIYIYMYMERLFLMFLDHTRRRSTVGRTPLDE